MNETTLSQPIDLDAPDSGKPFVSVVVVSWNALDTVKQCLPSVVASTYSPLEIIFADNASTDGSSEWIVSNYPSVKLVRNPENWAFCKGNNEAVRHASGKYVVLLNNDVEVPFEWLQPLVATLEGDHSIGAVQPKILDFSNRTRFEYAGGSGGFLDTNGYPFTRGRLFSTIEEDTGQYDDECDIFWASGAAVMFRKDLYDQLGGLDERLFMHMEEIDLCWRLQRKGYRIVCNPNSHVFHIGGASLAVGSSQKVYLNYRNNLLVLYKNLPRRVWPKVFLKRVLLDGIAVIRALFLLRPGESLAIFRAFAAAHRMKRTMKSDRPGSDETDVLPSYRGNIVSDYFVRGRRRYSDLPPDRLDS
ncbi:MAG: glycosyltransferase family 2 protein [Rhodothermia bacterium]|nr:MAG: glycosyltransferase family 2 protein [Rhodothermia bacterium]